MDVASLANGLNDRTREVGVCKTVAAIAGGYLLLCFIAPAMMPEGSVPELSGRANAMDYATEGSWGNHDHGEDSSVGHDQSAHGGTFAWTELNPLWAFVYGFGDLNCHQKHERSWEINGNQMPVCTRDIGIFLGLFAGAMKHSSRYPPAIPATVLHTPISLVLSFSPFAREAMPMADGAC